jgi:hypothetical protein
MPAAKGSQYTPLGPIIKTDIVPTNKESKTCIEPNLIPRARRYGDHRFKRPRPNIYIELKRINMNKLGLSCAKLRSSWG